MSKELTASAQRVQDTLKSKGFACEVIELPEKTRTSQEAAQAIGCQVGQIAKSLIFNGKHTHKPILLFASFPNRVNEKKISEERLLGKACRSPFPPSPSKQTQHMTY